MASKPVRHVDPGMFGRLYWAYAKSDIEHLAAAAQAEDDARNKKNPSEHGGGGVPGYNGEYDQSERSMELPRPRTLPAPPPDLTIAAGGIAAAFATITDPNTADGHPYNRLVSGSNRASTKQPKQRKCEREYDPSERSMNGPLGKVGGGDHVDPTRISRDDSAPAVVAAAASGATGDGGGSEDGRDASDDDPLMEEVDDGGTHHEEEGCDASDDETDDEDVGLVADPPQPRPQLPVRTSPATDHDGEEGGGAGGAGGVPVAAEERAGDW